MKAAIIRIGFEVLLAGSLSFATFSDRTEKSITLPESILIQLHDEGWSLVEKTNDGHRMILKIEKKPTQDMTSDL